MNLTTILHSPIFHGAVTGFVTAAAIDIHAVTGFKSWSDLKNYSWSVASFRWFIGIFTGSLAGAGWSLQ